MGSKKLYLILIMFFLCIIIFSDNLQAKDNEDSNAFPIAIWNSVLSFIPAGCVYGISQEYSSLPEMNQGKFWPTYLGSWVGGGISIFLGYAIYGSKLTKYNIWRAAFFQIIAWPILSVIGGVIGYKLSETNVEKGGNDSNVSYRLGSFSWKFRF